MLVHLASLSVLLLGATAGPLISRDDAPHEFPYREDLSAAVSKRQSSSYWYEEIDHQGISAFGPSGYVVYRNVMDYGATGKTSIRVKLHNAELILNSSARRKWSYGRHSGYKRRH